MINYIQTNADDTGLIALENQDYVEDKLISICEDMEKDGVHTIEIASGLLFVTHYLLSSKEKEDAKRYYKYLLKQCHAQIESLHEFYEFPIMKDQDII